MTASTKRKFELRVKGDAFSVPCYALELDSEEEGIELARQIILRMKVRRDSNGRIIVKPDAIKQVELLPVREFTGNYDPWPQIEKT